MRTLFSLCLAVCLFLGHTQARASSAPPEKPAKEVVLPEKPRPFVAKGCQNKVKGIFSFGRAGDGCDAGQFENEAEAREKFREVVFDETAPPIPEAIRYTNHLFLLIEEAAAAYIKGRNPKAKGEEVRTFQRAILAMAHQESYWSHYRISAKDKRLKLMKGDQKQSFGMLQIHSRWHKKMVVETKAWQITGNLAYGMDLYYRAWQAAAKAKCVKTLEHQARAAYSIYNAGNEASVCRWANPNHTWAKNDKGYYEKFRDQSWKSLLNPVLLERLGRSPLVDCVLDLGGSCRKEETR